MNAIKLASNSKSTAAKQDKKINKKDDSEAKHKPY